jgi:hypothetical protein
LIERDYRQEKIMPQSSAPRASTVVKTAALLMAVPALLAPMKVAAQQMAANAPNLSRCDQMSATDPKGAIACRVEALNKETAAARLRIQVAENNIDCAREVGELRAANPVATEIARELVRVSGRPAAEYGICRLRDGIRAGLAAKR